MAHVKNTINQVEDPLLLSIKNELDSLSDVDIDNSASNQIKKGTNKLLWNAPTYSAVGVDLNDSKNENPNAYWKKWAEEQEKIKQND
jgi:hypothetical protein